MNRSSNEFKNLLDKITIETFKKNLLLQEKRDRLESLEEFIFNNLKDNPKLKEKFEEYSEEKEGLMLMLGDNMFLEGISFWVNRGNNRKL